jgi:hypothetical protein
MPALRMTGTNFSLTTLSLAHSAPAMTRPCPSRYFGAGMNDVVGAVLDRPLQCGRAEAVVDGEPGSRAVGDVGQGADVAHLGERVGRRLGEQQPRVLPQRPAPFADVCLRDEGRLDAELGELAAEQHHGRAEHALRADDVVARLEQAHAEQQDRAHPARRRNARLRALERGEAAAPSSSPSGW